MQIPAKITPDPIEQATAEIRFETAFPDQTIIGIIFEAIRKEFTGELQNLPIVNIPYDMLVQDPNLIYQPHVRILNQNFVFQIGPRMISLSVNKPYPGWEVFKNRFETLVDLVIKTGIIRKVNRIGLRYINFFIDNVFEDIHIQILINQERISSLPLDLRLELLDKEKKLQHVIFLSNKAILTTDKKLKGYLIDIDTMLNEIDEPSVIIDNIEIAHQATKEIFFSKILTEKLINTLSPTYTN